MEEVVFFSQKKNQISNLRDLQKWVCK